MPETLQVVRLTDDEKTKLRNATSSSVADEVARDVRALMKEAQGPIQVAIRGVDASSDELRTVQAALNVRAEILAALPRTEATISAAATNNTALSIVNEGLELLT